MSACGKVQLMVRIKRTKPGLGVLLYDMKVG